MLFRRQIRSSLANRQEQAPPRTKHAFSQQSWITEECVIELEHDLGLVHGTIARIIQLGFHKVCARGVPRTLSEDHKAQRMVSAHSTNNMPFIVMISSNAFSLATRRRFIIISRRQKVLAGSEIVSVPRDKKNSKQANLLAQCFGTARVYCCGFHGKEHNNQCNVILCNPRKVISSHETTTHWTARLQQVFCTITLGPTSPHQHNSCSASDGQLGISAIEPRSGAECFHPFPALKVHLSGHKFANDDDVKTTVTSAEIAGQRILRAGRNEQIGQGPQYQWVLG